MRNMSTPRIVHCIKLQKDLPGLETAVHVPHVEEIQVTAKPDQQLLSLPEGSSYLGFIFARAESPAFVERAVREAHARLRFTIDPLIPVSPA